MPSGKRKATAAVGSLNRPRYCLSLGFPGDLDIQDGNAPRIVVAKPHLVVILFSEVERRYALADWVCRRSGHRPGVTELDRGIPLVRSAAGLIIKESADPV